MVYATDGPCVLNQMLEAAGKAVILIHAVQFSSGFMFHRRVHVRDQAEFATMPPQFPRDGQTGVSTDPETVDQNRIFSRR